MPLEIFLLLKFLKLMAHLLLFLVVHLVLIYLAGWFYQAMHLLALSAFPMWRSNLEKHWFTLVVCLKERAFAFLDSLYGAKDHFHLGIHDKLIENFITIWDQFVTPILRTRIDFENFDIVYPTVPQQNNWEDCGVFTIMYLKHRTPRTPIGNMFGAADVDNIRIRLANELYFSGFNSVDKTFVTHFFDDVKA
ncbi:uncharacterized protein [Triticum aestivum]|uniref:uncharacterized protein isoform X2 n=2 Tax=Triticum aestivum TaxID=4565 RepID=UPI001D00AA4D|nr:uncharacterized protein LOC123110941 isoform X2 [Triticum aestivum]